MKPTEKMRVRFVVLAMLVLILMQGMIIGFSTISSYQSIESRADSITEAIWKGLPNSETTGSRYFEVTVDENHTLKGFQRNNIKTVSEEQAALYAKKVLSTGKETGFYEGFRYRVYEENHRKTVIFLSRTGYLETLTAHLKTNLIFSGIALVLMLIVLIFVSGVLVKPMAQSYEKQREFITAASHHLKTPLAVMASDVALIESESGKSEWTGSLQTEIEKLADMTNELVTLSKMEEPSRKEPRILFPISDVVAEICQSYEAISKDRQVALNKNIESDLAYNGVENDLRKLVVILLDNAFKYVTENGEVRVSLSERGGLTLSVGNSSEAMEPDKVNHVFDRFYRLSEETQGFGLGLSIAKAIVEAHKGSITAAYEHEMFEITVKLK